MSTHLDIASWLAAQGMHVFPLRPGSKRPFANCPHCKAGHTAPAACRCLTAEQPCHGLLAATTKPELIRQWWTRTPRAGVGIATGPSGLVVLDLDRKPKPPAPAAHDVPSPVGDGLEALGALSIAAGATWPTTLTVATPSGGRHLYFRAPTGLEVPSDATGRVGHQIDVRAQGGYVVAPGTRITTPPEDAAGAYSRISATAEIAELPAWLRPRVTPSTTSVPAAPNLGAVRPGDHAPGYWQRVWEGQLTKVETEPGERWRLVYAAARRLANLATHDTAPWTATEAIDALTAAALRRRERTGKPLQPAAARRNAIRGWERGTHDGPESLLGRGAA
ncbi:bifunctional DNA primase/polymerase [Saccharopolyspora karakumensis]|uniref:Bifunctional DNA primase/polymerase n=1 Tax=Saccharopolyspora karakumensis TaxID=2530386 RepID=A0A4R5C4W3_9PSEU|nr:bifunctional DNA primase/polymerase [Saccharopolyspora karakumensis]TDD91954.1 bifunctional DNA primase/polymerase [Saccharopolyspora karakumensis]